MPNPVIAPQWDEFVKEFYEPYPFLPSGIFGALIHYRHFSLHPLTPRSSVEEMGIHALNQNSELRAGSVCLAFRMAYHLQKTGLPLIAVAIRYRQAKPIPYEDIGAEIDFACIGEARARQLIPKGLDLIARPLANIASRIGSGSYLSIPAINKT